MPKPRVLVAVAALLLLTAMLLCVGFVDGRPKGAPSMATPTGAPAVVANAITEAPERADAIPAMDRTPSTASLIVCCEVLRGSGEPFAGAAVLVETRSARSGAETSRVLADGDGMVRLPIVGELPIVVTFAKSSEQLHGRAVTVVARSSTAPPMARLVLYELDTQVHGIVTDLDDRPLAQARVSWRREAAPEPCDADGRFSLRVPSGMDGFRCLFLAPGHRSGRENVVLVPGADVELHVRLSPGPSVTGRVVDAAGRAIVGAVVETILQRVSGERALTDGDGHYVVDCTLGEHDKEQVAVRCPGFVPMSAWVKASNGVATQDFVMQAAGSVHGRVLAADGQPAVGAVVSNQPSPVFGDGFETATADESGAFVLDELAAGERQLHVRCVGFEPATASITVVSAQVVDTTIRLTLGAVARGTVVDDRGQPVRGAWVGNEQAYVATDARGHFELTGLAVPADQVEVMERDHLPLRDAPLSVTAPNHFVLTRAASLFGRVVDARTGLGLDDFTVSILGGDIQQGSLGVDWVRGGRRFQHGNGVWSARGEMLVPGSQWRVRVTAPGFAATSTMVEATLSEATRSDLVMTAGVRVVAHLLSASTGARLAAATVRRLDRAPGERTFGSDDPRATSAADGGFEFAAVAAGELWLEIAAPGTVTTTLGPFLVGAVDVDLGELRVGAGGLVTGTLRDEQGAALADCELHASSVHADGTQPTSVATRTRSDGSFEFAGLQEGGWRLFASIDGAAGTFVIDQRLTVSAGAQRVDVRAAGNGVLRGEVHGKWAAAATPTVLVRSADTAADEVGRGFVADAPVHDGRFCLRGLRAGRYSVSVMLQEGMGRPRFARLAEPVTVGVGEDVAVRLDLGSR